MAFGWFFDLVVLLPVVIQMGVWSVQRRHLVLSVIVWLVYLLLQLLVLRINLLRLDALYFSWFAPALLLLYGYYNARRVSWNIRASAVDNSVEEL